VTGVDERGDAIDVRDPLRDRLAALARPHAHDPQGLARALVGVTEIFGTDLRERPELVDGVADALRELLEHGALGAVRRFVAARRG
jgi:fructuronate reductase